MLTFLRALLSYKPASKDLIEFRHDICESCPARQRSWWRFYCTVCNCTIGTWRWPFNKLAHKNEECPLKRWKRA